MKRYRISLLSTLIPLFFSQLLTAQIHHMEPPFWWAGMNHPELQLMVHAKGINKTTPQIDYPGVSIQSWSLVDNPDFMFIDLYLDETVRPGRFEVRFLSEGQKAASYTYELKRRAPGSAERTGFNPSDVILLLMPDRFANGDPSNDEFDDMPDKHDRKDPYGRHGGDLQGIIDHLDYIADMGYTALWLNPVLENNMPQGAYHGYATTDFYRVDRRLGSNEDYLRLSRLAAEKGIKLIKDMIFNHCGSGHWWMEDMPSPDWVNNYPDYHITSHARTVNQDPYVSESDLRYMKEGWFVSSMPDLNQHNPFLRNYLIQNSIWWIEYAALAGIRQDTYPYPNKEALAEWNRRVLKEYPDFNITGEEWSGNQALVSYWQKGKTNADGYRGHMPSVLDFPLQVALTRALTEESGWEQGMFRLYECLANDFQYPDPMNLVTFPDNHDMSRFYMQVGKDIDLYRMGISFILTTRGIPQLFYGSEVLMTHPGNGHGEIRKDFPGGWEGDKVNAFTGEGLSKSEKEMQEFFRMLLNWRRDKPVIHHGQLKHFVPRDEVYVYFRYDEQDTVMVVMNRNRSEHNLELSRFSEMLDGINEGTDVATGRVYPLGTSIRVPAATALILELR